MVQSISPPFRPHYPWLQGEELFADELNAAIANARSGNPPGTYSLYEFGGRTDGVTDDSAAFNRALAAILSLPTGGKLIIAAGRTVLGSAITANIPAGMALTIEGMGQEASELYFSNDTDGFNFTMLNSGFAWGCMHLAAFTLTRGPTTGPNPPGARTGIALQSQNVGVNDGLKCTLNNLVIRGNPEQTSQWQNSLVMTGLSSVINSVQIRAPNGGPTDLGDALVMIAGFNATQYATANYISNCVFQGGSAGLVCGDFVQGVFVTGCSIIGQYDGIRCTNTGGAAGSEAIQITNCTFAAGHRDIWLQGWPYSCITNNTLQKFNGAASVAGYAGIEVAAASTLAIITGNSVTGVSSMGGQAGEDGTPENAIIVNSCSTCTVTGNTVGNMTGGTGIWLKGATVHAAVVGNAQRTTAIDVLQDVTANSNFVWGNTWTGSNGGVFTPFLIGTPNGIVGAIQYGNSSAAKPVRWAIGTDGAAEVIPAPTTPGNAGSNYHITAHDDNQNALGASFAIARNTGEVTASAYPASTGDYHFTINSVTGGGGALLRYARDGLPRWFLGTTGGETGGNVGSDLEFLGVMDDNTLFPEATIRLVRATGQIIMLALKASASYANDIAAGAANVPIGGLYRNGNVVQVRLT